MTAAGWSVVGGAETVAPRQRIRVTVAGEELVLWRGASGALHAWGNRCPHRGMRLSFGFVRGDELHCLYHGWRYGADGGCAAIPAHPELTPPATIRATVWRCIERDGFVYVARGQADPGAPPALGIAGPRYCRSIFVAASSCETRTALAAATPLGLALAGRCPIGRFAIGRPAEAGDHDPDGIAEEILTYRGGAGAVALALQPLGAAETAVHAVAAGAAGLGALARWLAAFRDGLEGTPAGAEAGA